MNQSWIDIPFDQWVCHPLTRCPVIGMGVFMTLLSCMLNFLKRSLVYFVCDTKVPSRVCLICKPRKNFNSHIIDISYFSGISLPNFLLKRGSVDPKIISSTYI